MWKKWPRQGRGKAGRENVSIIGNLESSSNDGRAGTDRRDRDAQGQRLGCGSGCDRAARRSSASYSATISANDFLTLLVTEMQNQDPTADTDPNEYINQLVQVNSLEQLISINQNLSTALGDPTHDSSGGTAASPASSATAMRPARAQPPQLRRMRRHTMERPRPQSSPPHPARHGRCHSVKRSGNQLRSRQSRHTDGQPRCESRGAVAERADLS